MTTGVGTVDRVTTRRLLARGWRTWVPVVIGNAAVQAATTAPFATPAVAAGFLALAVLSLLALVVSVVLVVSQSAASAAGVRWRTPSPRLWIAGAAAVLIIGGSAVVLAPLLLLTMTAALIMLPAIASGAGSFAGFRVFAAAPLHAISLTICTVLVLALLWVAALLSGFFLTGALSAALTWLVLGVAGVVLIAAWSALVAGTIGAARSGRLGASAPGGS
jgi:hypothetical protein